MGRSIRPILAVLCGVAIVVLFVTACSVEVLAPATDEGEFINPGAALAPTANEDWYELIAREEEYGISFQRMLEEVPYAVLLRGDSSSVLSPNWVTVVDQTLSDGTIVTGYTLRYGDRIALFVTPTDRKMDANTEAKDREITPDVTGERHPWNVVSIRGVEGVARSATTQKWQSGDMMAVPSVVEWQVVCEGPAPFIRYALVGDIPIDDLIIIADSLR
ncbi:hypothetical protein [Anaerosoma tenue]|uniref:hypothetical protein n=1 Tax=Anaerosoma tenue TaxID=2933588 RepID=UPI0022608D82|nr:hypothetical protein [Anaerosoma tenue]MCK8115929.1 hypothetical protein [Anaerosoma tenue]